MQMTSSQQSGIWLHEPWHLSLSWLCCSALLWKRLQIHLTWFLCVLGYATRVGFVALTAVVMKSSVYWNITPRSPLKTDVSEEHSASSSPNKPSKNPAWKQPSLALPATWFLSQLILLPWGWNDKFLRNTGWLQWNTRPYIPQYSSWQETHRVYRTKTN
jgi:hypothetical protein